MYNPFETLQKGIEDLSKKIDALNSIPQESLPEKNPDPLDDFIPKSEVRGKLASSSTLWKYEKEGKLQAYSIGGKRFYKRSEIMDALVKLKK